MKAALLFALAAHPTVQLIRFSSKAVMVYFLAADQLGEASFAGLLVNLALIAAVLGLDEAVIYTPHLGRDLWHRLRRLHHVTGIAMALVVTVVGHFLGLLQDYPLLGVLTAALAPSVWLANMAVLPTALLVRRREYQRVFFLDLWSVLALTGTTVGLAAAGAGAWSLVGGWYANALVSAVAANVYSRPFRPGPAEADGADGAEDALAPTLRYGAHMTGAGLTGFGSERVDQFVVAGLGAAAYGLYDWALHMSLFVANYATSLSERILFPVLAERGRRGELAVAAREALRVAVTLLIPAHVLLGMTARPLVLGLAPTEWHPAATPLLLLALAAGARSLDVTGLAILKASGLSRMVLALGLIRIGLVIAGALLMVQRGIVGVAIGVLGARILAAALVLALAGKNLPPATGTVPGLRRALLAVVVWCAIFVPLVRAVPLSGALPIIGFQAGLAAALWLGVRLVLDGANLRRDRKTFAGWLAARSES